MDRDRKLDELRWQGFDQRLTAALHDVPVPAGLSERLLARLNAEGSRLPAEVPVVAEDRPPVPVGDRPSAGVADRSPLGDVLSLREAAAPAWRFAFTRRSRVFAIVAGLSVAASVCVWLASLGRSQSSDALELAASWNTALDSQPPSWADMGSAPRGFPVPKLIRASARSWTDLKKIVGRAGAAYDLGGAGRSAYLFAVKMPDDPALPSSAPASPQGSTGGVMIGVWQSGGIRYVLVVKGDERAYRELIESLRTPLAWSPHSRPISLPAA